MSVFDYLIVDDDEVFRDRLSKALRERGQNVSEASSVAQALETLASGTPRHIILDLRMPEESGLRLLENMAEKGITSKVVVLTGYGSIATATRAIKLGAINYLTKPVGVNEILQAFAEENDTSEKVAVPSLDQVEWDYIHRILNNCNGNVSHAAKLLGMHRRSLQRKLQKSPTELK